MTDKELVIEAMEARKKSLCTIFRIYGRSGASDIRRKGIQGMQHRKRGLFSYKLRRKYGFFKAVSEGREFYRHRRDWRA